MTQSAARAIKATIRQQIRLQLDLVDPQTALRAGDSIVQRLSPLAATGPGALFCACNGEVDLRSLHSATDRPLAYPRCMPARQLRFGWCSTPPTSPGLLGIPAPAADAVSVDPTTLSFVVVPGAAFDRNGHRLGWGAGYYDRFLATLPAHTLRIGVGHDWQVVNSVPSEPHDIPMHFILTPNILLDCRRTEARREPEAAMESL